MISWIQITFEKHTKVFLAFLLIVITVPFVFTIGAAPGIGRGERTITEREFFGYNIVNPGAKQRLFTDAQISLELRPEAAQSAGVRNLERFSYMRTAGLDLANRYRIPQPTTAQRTQFLTALSAFKDEQGQFDAARYNQFRDSIRAKQSGVGEADVARVLSEEYRLQQIDRLLAGPGYVAPVEVANLITLQSTQWTLRVATFDLATFNPAIAPSEEVLAKYFEDNKTAFVIEDRISADFVTFKAADFATADPLREEDIAAFFEANKYRFATPAADGKPAAEPTLATVRPKVEAAMHEILAGRRAAASASDFAYELYEQSAAKKINKTSAEIDALVAKYHGRRATAPLFTRNAPPAGLPWNKQIVDAAFLLDDARFFSDALPLGNDQIVLLWRETFPTYQPKLEEVRADVLADYTTDEKAAALNRSGEAWKSALAAKLTSGTKFDDAVATLAGAPKSEIKEFGPFSLRQPPQGIPPAVFGALDQLASGTVSSLLIDQNGKNAYIVYTAAKKLPTVDNTSPEFAALTTDLAGSVANISRALALNDLVRAELARTEPEMPKAQ
jgi:peptidyl-prolyl cis-trans isomerase D